MQLSLMNIKSNNHINAQFPTTNYSSGIQKIYEESANEAHYMSWGMYSIINLAKFDSSNIEEKINQLSNQMIYDRYVRKKESIDKFIEDIKTNKLVSGFRIYNNEWKATILKDKNEYKQPITRISVDGDIFKHYGGYEEPRKKCKWFVDFFRKGGTTYVQDFGSTCY